MRGDERRGRFGPAVDDREQMAVFALKSRAGLAATLVGIFLVAVAILGFIATAVGTRPRTKALIRTRSSGILFGRQRKPPSTVQRIRRTWSPRAGASRKMNSPPAPQAIEEESELSGVSMYR